MLNYIENEILVKLPEILNLRSVRTKKTDDSYVTEGDLLVEKIVIETVREYLESALIVSEEIEEFPSNEAMRTGNVIIVDPVDGTENFTSGLLEWGVSLCHYKDGIHQESLLLCPELGEKIGTGQKLQPRQSRIAGISSSLTKEDILKLEPGYEYRILGCCVNNMMNVISGKFATFENPKGARVWDIIGGLNLALEHGLSVTVNEEVYRGELLDPRECFRFRIERSFAQGNLQNES